MTVEIPQNEKTSGGKNGRGKGDGCSIRQRRANRGSINTKE